MAEIINDNARGNGEEEIGFDDLAIKYPNHRFFAVGLATVTVSSHYELTLALYSQRS